MAEEIKEPKESRKIKISGTQILLIALIILGVVNVYFSYSTNKTLNTILSGGTNTGGTNNTGGTVKFSIPTYETPLGSSSAKVNMIEFADYQCPYCQKYFMDTEPQIKQNYVDTGKIKYYFFDFAFLGPDSQTLAQGAWCANDQGKFWDYYTYIYSNQGQEQSGWGTSAKVKAMVGNITGLDVSQFSSCLDSGKYATRVQTLTAAGQSVGITGTPGFLIGNDKLGYTVAEGALPYAQFQTVLDSALQKS